MVLAYFSPHQVSTILAILIIFKFTHTHKKNNHKKQCILLKTQAVLLTN